MILDLFPHVELIITESIAACFAIVVALIIYYVKKYAEIREIRRDTAFMLQLEITDILRAISNEFSAPTLFISDIDVIPNNMSYVGLLHSGNIRHFPRRVQRSLHDFYRDGHALQDAYSSISMLAVLGEVMRKNRGFRDMARGRKP